MQLIIFAAGLSLVSAAALPQLDQSAFEELSGTSVTQPGSEPPSTGQDPSVPGVQPDSGSPELDENFNVPTGEAPSVGQIPVDPNSEIVIDDPDAVEVSQGATPSISGEFDRAEGEACVAAMIVDFPSEKQGVDCTCFCGGLSCINVMVDEQAGLDFRTDPRIPISCQAKFDKGDQSQAEPQPFNGGAGGEIASSGGTEPDSLPAPPTADQLGENPTPGRSPGANERISEGEEVLNQNESFNTPEEQLFRDIVIKG